MKRAGCRALLATGAAALIGAAGAFTPMMAAADAPAPKTAADCRAIADFTLRGQCWDSLDKENQQDAQATKKREFGLGQHAPSGTAVKRNKEDVAREAKQKKEEVNTLVLTLADVQNTPRGLLLMTATDGAIWEQTDGDAVPGDPVPGDTVTVKKGFLGGYFCQVNRWEEVRCQRDR
jgi:hypothetical protein